MTIDTNLRSVKRNGDSVTNLNKISAQQRPLCDYCGRKHGCAVQKMIRQVQEAGAFGAITTCTGYSYPIHFRDMTGLDQPGANTIRLGKAFSERLRVGDEVSILDAEKKFQRFATIRTLELVSLTIPGLLPYAHRNHMIIKENLEADLAADKLLKILRNNYGNMVFKNNTHATIIGF